MGNIQRNLTNHVVIVGYGASGAEALDELLRLGASVETLVVIDVREAALRSAKDHGAAVMEGDATRNATLEAAQIGKARAVIVAAGRDDTSILIVLTARRLAPDVAISVVIDAQENEVLAKQAGADTVINPSSFAGLLLAGSTHGRHIADYLADLAGCEGGVALRERLATADEYGKPLASITTGVGLRLHRGAQAFGTRSAQAAALQPGDCIIEVVEVGA